MKAQNIYDFITTEEANFNLPIAVIEGWDWNFKEHINVSTLYKNSQLTTNKNKGTIDEKPVKNIVSPILDLRYRAEDIDVKDIVLYVDDPEKYHLSFLVKKYHDDVFVIENDLDTYFDELKESKIDFGGGLTKDIGKAKPDIVPLQSLAFCDQTDLLSGPIGIKHEYSPDQLKDMEEFGWGKKSNGATGAIDEVIKLADTEKTTAEGRTIPTPGKYIEVYEVHGMFPESFLKEDGDPDKFSRQLHIVTFYQNEKKEKKGIALFKGKESKNPFKLAHSHKDIFGRALGVGGVEELTEAQIWTNYDMIRMKELLDAASKILLLTDDSAVAARHPSGMKGMDNLEMVEVETGKKGVWQMDTFPRSLNLFDRSVNEWWLHAQTIGFAHDPMLGMEAPSGTPFRAQERQVIEGKGQHEYRRGKYAKFIEELYKDWFIPHIVKKITSGTTFLSELSLEEMQKVADNIVVIEANKMIKDRVLAGQTVTQEEVDLRKKTVRDDFMKDNKKFIKILKDELKGAPVRVKVNVAGKQKNLSVMVDKLTNVVRFALSTYNPQTGQFTVFQDPQMAKLFNQILESSGLSPIDYGAGKQPILTAPQPPQAPVAPPMAPPVAQVAGMGQ